MGRLGQLVLISFGGKGPVRLRDDFYFFNFFYFCRQISLSARSGSGPFTKETLSN